MKRLLSLFLALILMFSVFAQNAWAQSDENRVSFSFADAFYAFGGTVVNLCSRAFHSLFPVDETVTDAPQIAPASWTAADESYRIAEPEQTLNAQTWVMNEIRYTSGKPYADPFEEVDVDLILTGNSRCYTVPGFWDGNGTWKFRFVCPSAGTWYFTTECSDRTNTDLNHRTGKVICTDYSGDKDIYRHGFVTVRYGKKYFTYDDGTPFFYLGDTHWSLGDETVNMVEHIARHRAEQGFTVIQSEPIGAGFDLTNGVTQADLAGFADYDKKFDLIAQAGLTHANAEFFFPSYMSVLIDSHGGYAPSVTTAAVDGKQVAFHDLSASAKHYLQKLSRYWVARYSAYPVLWTLGQEVDDDFYWKEDILWGVGNNPYRAVATYIAQYDPYDHPLTAHQENCGGVAAYGDGSGAGEQRTVYRKGINPSAFWNQKEHNWYAVQWSPSKTKQSRYEVEKEYWYNSQGKPAINYEGAYCCLWTKNYGARMQGWCAYLNGMYGYGWGGHDTWSYLNTYDEENDSSDGVDTITSQEKINVTWLDAQEYASSYQVGYMKEFLEKTGWSDLIPRFDNRDYFVPDLGVYACTASSKDNTKQVIYFYSFSDPTVAQKKNTTAIGGKRTGTIGNLEPNGDYAGQWFNPVTGEASEKIPFRASPFGTHYIGTKQWNGKTASCDMVYCITKQ